jgi:hypothetical protein
MHNRTSPHHHNNRPTSAQKGHEGMNTQEVTITIQVVADDLNDAHGVIDRILMGTISKNGSLSHIDSWVYDQPVCVVCEYAPCACDSAERE